MSDASLSITPEKCEDLSNLTRWSMKFNGWAPLKHTIHSWNDGEQRRWNLENRSFRIMRIVLDAVSRALFSPTQTSMNFQHRNDRVHTELNEFQLKVDGKSAPKKNGLFLPVRFFWCYRTNISGFVYIFTQCTFIARNILVGWNHIGHNITLWKH